MLRRRFFVALVGLIMVAALAASPIFAAPSPQAGQTLTIGVIGAADGPTLRGVSLAVEQANAQGVLLPDNTPVTLRVIAVDAGDQVPAAIDQLRQANIVALFGPDNNATATSSLPALTAAGLPVFTAATSADVKTGGFIFRTRAADSVRMTGLADVLLTDVKATRITVYQGNQGAPAASALVVALAMRGVTATPVLQDPNRPVADAAAVILQNQPDCIAAFGDPAQVAELWQTLKAANYAGKFATDQADNPAFIAAVPMGNRGGIYGITGWSAAWDSQANRNFILAYVRSFAAAPDALSAAAYDGAINLIQVIKKAGITPSAILAAMMTTQAAESLQGTFNPALGNGETTANASVIQTNVTGAGVLVARFENATRLSLNAQQVPPAAPTLAAPPTQPAAPTLVPPPPIVITATPVGVVATVLSDFVNVRYGPGTVYNPPIGRLTKDMQVQLLGADLRYQWYVINFQGRQAWISGDPTLVSVWGDIKTLPVVAAPPTPTPAATATPTGVPGPDIVLVSAFVNPSPIKSGQPFTLTVTIKNQGTADAGAFAVAASFDPGGVFGAMNVTGLPAGQQTTFTINFNAVNGVGTFTVAIVLDLNNQLPMSPEARAHAKPTFTYQVVQ
jgi:ABC-type branched-subunit amino acid transport system substrate-binding protein